MASSMAAAAAHSMPPFPLPAIPRIRPPPIPKGTPGPNTLPQPGPPPRSRLVWVDGRWATPHSRSVKHKQEVVSKQLEKALQHEVHGMNIYAYKHMRTHQVVYSLTKNMDNTKILKQLLYHGKKTVPAALRRDVWRPYFSVHFPKTPAGSSKGLRVFQELRELSALRQLKPPKEMTIATQEDLDNLKKNFDPVEWLEKTENVLPKKKLLQPPVVGERLPRKMLAKRLMNQAATSVADIAAILTRQTNAEGWKIAQQQKKKKDVPMAAVGPTPQQRMNETIEKRKAKEEALSIRASNRLAEIRKNEEAKAEQLEQRQQYMAETPGMVKIDQHTRDRINIEYDGIGQKLTMIEEADQNTRTEIGATVALRRALENLESEKRTQRENIEKSMGAQIEQRLMELTEVERDQIEKEVEADRAQRQSEIDAQVAATREKYKEQRARLYEQPANYERMRALRKLSRDSQAEVYKMKTDLRTRYLKWAGPFASIATEVDKEMSAIDARWEPTLVQLREEVEAEKERHANINNHEVQIRWADIRDGTYAKSWPDTVFHAELQAKAVIKQQHRAATTEFHYDDDEEAIETQIGLIEAQRSSTVHVFGSASPDAGNNAGARGRYEYPSELMARKLESRAVRVQQWTNTEAIVLRDRIIAMRKDCEELKALFENKQVDSDRTPRIASSMDAVQYARTAINTLSVDSYSPDQITDIDGQIQFIRENHSYCLEQLPKSKNHEADEARVRYAKLEAEIMSLEIRNHEARRQVTTRESFFARFNGRQVLTSEIDQFMNDQERNPLAITALKHFDLEIPMVKNVFNRRGAAIQTLRRDIKETKAEIARLQEGYDFARTSPMRKASEQKQKMMSLEEDIEAKHESLKSLTAKLNKPWRPRDDKQAWLEFKSGIEEGPEPIAARRSLPEGGGSVFEDKTPAVADNNGMVMDQPDDTKEEIGKTQDKAKGLMRFAGLGRFFGSK